MVRSPADARPAPVLRRVAVIALGLAVGVAAASAAPAAAGPVPRGSGEPSVSRIGPEVVLANEAFVLRPAEPLRHGFTLDLEVRAVGGPATLSLSAASSDATETAVVEGRVLDERDGPVRLQVGWESIEGRLTVGRPGALPEIARELRLSAVGSLTLRASGALTILLGDLRHGGPRANAHTPIRDLLISAADPARPGWRALEGRARLVESGDLPVWQAERPGASLGSVGPTFIASRADAPRVVVAFAARVVESGRVSVDLVDAAGRGIAFRVEPAGDPGGRLVRLGWRERLTAADGRIEDGPEGDAIVVDGRVPSAGEPVRVNFEWDRSTGAVVAQAERSPAFPLSRASISDDPDAVLLRLDAPGDAIGAVTVGTVPRDAIDARRHGAVGDGIADDGPALRRALVDARGGGGRGVVYLPPGVYSVAAETPADLLTVGSGVTLIGAGHGSVIVGARRERAAVRLAGRGPTLARVRVLVADPRTRSSEPVRAAVNLVRDTVTPVVVDNELGPTEETGLMAFSADRPLVARNRVLGTLADGIHFTHATRGVRVAGNLVRRTHDDAIAIVSYRRWAGRPVEVVRDADIVDNDVGRNRLWGRGIAVVGGADVRIRRNRIVDTNAAGLLLAAEGHYDTAGVRDVVVEDNVIERPRVGFVPHAGVLLWADAGAPWRRIENVVLRRNRVESAGWRGWTIGCGSRDIEATDNAILSSADLPVMVTGTGGRIRLNGNRIDGGPDTTVLATAIDTFCPDGSTGSLEIHGNEFGRAGSRARGTDCPAALVVRGPPDRSWSMVRVTGNRFAVASGSCAGLPVTIDASIPQQVDPCDRDEAVPVSSTPPAETTAAIACTSDGRRSAADMPWPDRTSPGASSSATRTAASPN